MKLWRKFIGLFSRNRLEREMADEMQAHLDGLTERNRAAGMSPEEARYAAQRAFGGVEQIKERARDEREWVWLGNLGRDLRFSFRSLRRSPAFSITVILTLALCIGANTAVVSVLYGMILKPLPIPHPEQVVEIYNSRPQTGQLKQRVSAAQYLDYKAHADLLEHVALWDGWMFNIGEYSGADRLVGMLVTADYFAVLGVQPLLGRFFTDEECQPGRDGVVVLTQTYWEKHFHADPTVLGREISLSRRKFTIIGVAPRSLEAVSVAPVLVKPFVWAAEYTTPRYRLAGMGTMYARIKLGVTDGAALAQLQTLEKRFRDEVGDSAFNAYLGQVGQRMGLGQIRAEQTSAIKNGLLLLQGGALLVLLLGCVNVAGLTLARANARRTELAVRQALGAGRMALGQQLITEAVLLAVAGGALGLVLAWAGLRLINTYTAVIVYGSPPVTLDGNILGLTLVVSATVALLIGLLPVLRAWRMPGLHDAGQTGARGSSAGASVRAMSGGLVIAQVALALVLLIGAGLLVRSFAKVVSTNPGFDAAKVIHARVAVDESYVNATDVQTLQRRLLEKMREIPGVESVAYSAAIPGSSNLGATTLPLRDMPPGKESTYPTAIMLGVSPDFLRTLGIRLLEGRNFNEADMLPDAQVALIVDRRFAERYFPGRSAVGRLFSFGQQDQKPEAAPVIVGVAETARFGGLDDRNREPYVYRAMPLGLGGLSLLLRTSRTLEDMLPLIRARVRDLDPELPVYEAQTMQMHLDDAGANRRAVLWLLGVFAGLALLLAATGIYGLLAYDVTQRTREMGIRGAVGATSRQIVALILRQGMAKAGVGMAIGLVVALVMSRVMGSMLYEVRPRDPLVFTSVSLVLLGVALVASWLPARRAARVDPMEALRCE
ncbi:MAG: ABC transporter permease [Opitutaceae bacterium]|nr:ABC transporter permease [Opitutaceae bacterium]